MKIVHFNTFDLQGGAARAAYRLHKGLLEIGQESRLLSMYKFSQDSTVLQVPYVESDNQLQSIPYECIQTNYIDANRTSICNTFFSFPYPGLDLHQLEEVQRADLINLHWITYGFQSPSTLKKIAELGKPIVWTLHDMWPFTGGCHYSAGCEGYQQECLNCPQLQDDSLNLPHAVLKDKLELLRDYPLTVVTPSQWLAKCARQSKLFQRHRLEVIPNALETDVFVPTDKSEAKKQLKIAADSLILLVGSADGSESRKGFLELVEVLHKCRQNFLFSELVNYKKIKICCFGIPSSELTNLPLEVVSLGRIDSDRELSQIYAAADIFILPSLEDNFPNTMLEAMSCGTPVVGFDIGGIPDLVKSGETGFTVPARDTEAMAQVIIKLIDDRPLRDRLSVNCRKAIAEGHSLTRQANRYLSLYQELWANNNKTREVAGQPPDSLANKSSDSSLLVNLDVSFGSGLQGIFKDVALKATVEELVNTRNNLKSKIAEIETVENQRNHYKLSCEHYENSLNSTRAELSQTSQQLQQSNLQLEQTQGQLEQTNLQLNAKEVQVSELANQLNQTQNQLGETERELTRTKNLLNEVHTQILAMETSKFWKLRTKWFQLRQLLGIQGD